MIIDELDADELPQPIFSNSGTPSVKCKVCNNLIDLDGKLDCYVVKCLCCQEATVSCASRHLNIISANFSN